MSVRMSAADVTKLLGAQEKRSKFGVDNSENGKLKRTFKDVVYASEYEASIAAELELKKRAGLIRDWVRQVNVPLIVNGITVGKMLIDFKVVHNDNSIEFVEAKGNETPLYRMQRKLFDALNRGVKYTVRKERS